MPNNQYLTTICLPRMSCCGSQLYNLRFFGTPSVISSSQFAITGSGNDSSTRNKIARYLFNNNHATVGILQCLENYSQLVNYLWNKNQIVLHLCVYNEYITIYYLQSTLLTVHILINYIITYHYDHYYISADSWRLAELFTLQ